MLRTPVLFRLCLFLAVIVLASVGGPFGWGDQPVQPDAEPAYAQAASGGPLFFPFVVRDWPPAAVDLAVGRIEVIQGITMGDSYTVHVAGRPALLRAFVGLNGVASQPSVTGRLTRYAGGAPQDSIDAGPITVQASTDEGQLSQTLNFNLPGHWLTPGTQYVLSLDPANAILETDELNNRYPAGGAQAFDFVNAPALDVVVVPIRYARPGAAASIPNTSDLTFLTWMPLKVYPVAQINYSVRPAVHDYAGDLRSSSGWTDLLYQITNIHAQEDPAQSKEYYGLVDSVAVDGCSGGCIAGIGWVNSQAGFGSKTAVGFAGFPNNRNDASTTFTHEMGHNFGRRHAPCGNPSGVGPYPYGNGAPIGQWGYDTASAQMYAPTVYRDYMSYCGPEWTSDFTYRGIYDAWSWLSLPYGPVSELALTEALVVDGYVDEAGQIHLGSAFVQRVPAARLAGQGPYTLELVDAAGNALARRSFDGVPFIVDPDRDSGLAQGDVEHKGFQVALPVTEGASGLRLYQGARLLYARQAGAAPPRLGSSAQLTRAERTGGQTWSLSGSSPGAVYRISFSPDGGETWWLLEPETAEPVAHVPDQLIDGAIKPLIEVQASNGVQVTRRVYEP
jgi:hypothetical protein